MARRNKHEGVQPVGQLRLIAERVADCWRGGPRPELEPRWCAFGREGGPIFWWTVQRAADGKFHSGIYQPVGPGARICRAASWRQDYAEYSHHQLRRDARARARRLFEAWEADQ